MIKMMIKIVSKVIIIPLGVLHEVLLEHLAANISLLQRNGARSHRDKVGHELGLLVV